MSRFTDMHGRTFACVVTVRTVIALKQQGVDLNQLVDGDLLDRLASDPEFLVNTLWLVVELTEGNPRLTAEEFGGSLGGDTLAAATDALLDAFVSFFRPSQRPALQQLLTKGREVETLGGQQLLQKLTAVDPQTILNSLNSVSSGPASSASIPATSH